MVDTDRITPTVWGPTTWKAIHFIALGYPEEPSEEHIKSYGSFFVDAFPRVIPCKKCADNYLRHLQELPIAPYLYSGGKHRLFEWTVELHNIVNKELGKDDQEWTVERALKALVANTAADTVGDKVADTVSPSVVSPESILSQVANVPMPSHALSPINSSNMMVSVVIVIMLIALVAFLLILRKHRSA